MDSDLLRETCDTINECACAYEKTILTHQGDCSRGERYCIAEREGVRCSLARAQAQCRDYLHQLRIQSRFVFKNVQLASELAHAKAMRLQIGGLRGLHVALYPDQPVPAQIEDIHSLLYVAAREYGHFTGLPFQVIVQQLAAYQGRPARTSRRDLD